jgi:hypothetical protein
LAVAINRLLFQRMVAPASDYIGGYAVFGTIDHFPAGTYGLPSRRRPVITIQYHFTDMDLLYWKILLQVLSVAIVIIVSLLDYVKHDKFRRHFTAVRWSLFILLIVFLGLNLFVVFYDERAKFTADQAKSQEISELKGQIKVLENQGDLINNLITGGDSFAYVEVYPIDGNSMNLMVNQKGQFPLYDVSVIILDNKKLKKPRTMTVNSINAITIANESKVGAIQIGNMFVNAVAQVMHLKLDPVVESQTFEIVMSARNGSFTESLRLRRINGQWLSAIKVTRGKAEEKIYERISEAFPRDEKGEIDWTAD